eukprot:scaffold28117_cov64-Phaeocystis_antarctica.AAC.6
MSKPRDHMRSAIAISSPKKRKGRCGSYGTSVGLALGLGLGHGCVAVSQEGSPLPLSFSQHPPSRPHASPKPTWRVRSAVVHAPHA